MKLPFRRSVSLICCFFPLLLACSKEQKEEPARIVFPEAVDLGLSVKWASFDVGATQPGEVGYFFAWGEATPKENEKYNWHNYNWCKYGSQSLTKYNYDPAFGDNPDYRIGLKPEDDPAQVMYGGDWYVPTVDEIKELIESPLLRQSVERVGYKDCMKLTSLVTGESILLPAGSVCMDTSGPHGVSAGFFWSSQIVYSPNNPKPYEATCAVIYPEVASSTFNTMSTQKMPRAYGMNIRPVLRK